MSPSSSSSRDHLSPPPPGSRPRLPFRSRVEHAVIPALGSLSRMPRPLVLLGVLVVFAVGAFVPHGGALILLLAVVLGLLLYVTWPQIEAPERMLRLAVLVLTIAVGIVRLTPR